jgi:hypothetical protein
MAQTANAAAITRKIFRWIHIVFSIPIVGYIYSPFEDLPYYAAVVRHVFVPALVLSGLWIWKGHLVRRVISRGLAIGTGSYAKLRPSIGG